MGLSLGLLGGFSLGVLNAFILACTGVCAGLCLGGLDLLDGASVLKVLTLWL